MPLPGALRGFNRVVTNRVLGVFSGVIPPFATVIHRGRRTGKIYRTTAWAFPQEETVAIALTYGPEVDWAKNLLAAARGAAELVSGRWELINPRLVGAEEGRPFMPPLVREALGVVNVHDYLLADRSPNRG